MKSLSHVQLFATPWTLAHQAPPSMGCSRQEYWSGVPFPSPGDLPNPGIKPTMGSLQLMRRGVLCRPNNYINCWMQRRNESRTGRRCLEGQTADLAVSRSKPLGVRRSKPTQILMPILVPGSNSGLFDSNAGSGVNLPIIKLSHIVNIKALRSMTISVSKNSLSQRQSLLLRSSSSPH